MTHQSPTGGPVKKKILIFFLCLLLSATALFSSVAIKQVKYFSDDEKTRVIFESDQPVIYSAYTNPEKTDVVVLDFPDIKADDLQQVINVFSPELKNIQFSTITLEGDAFITRAELQLTTKLLYNISQQRNFLYIDVLKQTSAQAQPVDVSSSNTFDSSKTSSEKTSSLPTPAEEKKNISESPISDTPPAVKPEQRKEAIKPLKKLNLPAQLREITYDMNVDNIAVNLIYDGDPEYSTFELQKPDRLIVDLHSTTNRSYPKQVNLKTDKILKIRTAQFQTAPVPITRVVFDIKQPLNYRVIKTASGLTVGFGPDTYLNELSASLNPPATNEMLASADSAKDVSDEASISAESANIDVIDSKNTAVQTQSTEQTAVVDAEIKNEDLGQVQSKLFETADSAGITPSLLGQEVPVENASAESAKKIVSDNDYSGKVVAQGKKYVGEAIGMNFKDVDIRDVILIIGNITGKNFIVDQKVKGKVTINFTSVPWDQALDIILSMNNLGMTEENNVIMIAPMDQLEAKAKKEASLEEERTLAGPVDVFTRRISYAKAEDVAEIVKAYISRRGQVIVDKRTNLLLIRELRSKMDSLQKLIDELDIATRQVHIEARIIETTRTYEKDLGIQWGFDAIASDETGNATRYIFPHNISVTGGTSDTSSNGIPYAVNLPASSPTSGLELSLGNVLGTFNLDLKLTAMEESGKGRILASPSISTQNNIEATIMSGSKIPYTSIVDNTASVTFIQAKLELKVTPQITSDNTIIMKVDVEKTEPDYSVLITNVQGALPTILEKKASTTMLVKDGGTAVIGGILQVNDSESERRVPFFYKIPLLGWLFKANNWQRSDSEMLIFITPQILGYK